MFTQREVSMMDDELLEYLYEEPEMSRAVKRTRKEGHRDVANKIEHLRQSWVELIVAVEAELAERDE